MPIYEYICGRCKKFYEYFHNGSQDKKAICPHCGSNDAKKQVSKSTSHILKGRGWYKDGYG